MLEKYGYKYADVVVGTIPNLREHVTGVLGYEREVKCVPMGFDIEEIKDTLPLPSGFREKYSLNKPFVVVHAGSVGVTNALGTFFLCAQSLTDIPQIQFVLLGDGYMKAQYQERFKHLSNMTFARRCLEKWCAPFCENVVCCIFQPQLVVFGDTDSHLTKLLITCSQDVQLLALTLGIHP